MTKLAPLLPVLEVIANHEKSKMAQIQDRETQLRAKFAALASRPCDSDFSPAGLAGAHVAFEIWSQRAREQLNLELASILAEKEEARERTGRAVGRLEVLKRLCETR